MNDLIATALAAAIVAASNAPAGPGAGLEGRWAMAGASCAGSEGVLDVSRKGFLLTETSCRFGARAPEGFSSVAGSMSCSGEGEGYAMKVAMVAEGNQALLQFERQTPIRFRRC